MNKLLFIIIIALQIVIYSLAVYVVGHFVIKYW